MNGTTKQTVLIIEDNDAHTELARDLLAAAGFSTFAASSAEEGVVLARTKHPDLVLMDLSLPGIDGLSATRILKSDPRTRHIPVVAVTARSFGGGEDLVAQAGCCRCIAKPIDSRLFAAQIDETFAAEARRARSDANSATA